jgi:hormone-sensitive lipase
MMGLDIEKIIVIGDSAGGNLVAALTVMAIERNYRVPDGLILCYPALNLSKRHFTPSLLLSLDDPILPYPFLKMCMNSYCGSNIETKNPFCNPDTCQYLSPVQTSNETMKLFPKTRIMVAANDPLRDESFRFAFRLLQNGVDVFMKEYQCLPHGFLNFNAPLLGMKDECNEAIRQCQKWIIECSNDSVVL